MPRSALPPRLQDPAGWVGTDHDTAWMRWLLPLKGWLAYGPRATEWWARWREWPKTLFAIRSRQGLFRAETETWERDSSFDATSSKTVLMGGRTGVLNADTGEVTEGYLSRVQYYTRWSFQIQWPFMVAFHWYAKSSSVPIYGQRRENTDGKLWFFYFGAHRDADKVYWWPSAYFGRNWK